MGKKHKGHAAHDSDVTDRAASPTTPAKMKAKEYQRELRRLHGELVAMQEWVKRSGAKVCVVFEGRDTAGKGGTIKAITERVSPRVFRVVARCRRRPSVSDRRCTCSGTSVTCPPWVRSSSLTAAGTTAAGVERVMGFCTDDDTTRFLSLAPAVEKAMVDSGIVLVKYWLEVGQAEQTRRLESRIEDARKVWKLSDMDLKSYAALVRLLPRETRCSRRRTANGRRGTSRTPTTRSAAVSTSSRTCCNAFRTSRLERKRVTLPERQPAHGYNEADLSALVIPSVF